MEGGGALGGPVTNNGQLVVSPGTTLGASGEVLNLGTIVIGKAAQFLSSGSYAGDGHISGPGLMRFAGLLSSGNSPTPLEIAGDAVLEASSETVLELAGLSRGATYDSLQVGGTLTLGGTLSVTLLDGFAPLAGASFLLMQAALIEGSFAQLHLPSIAGLHFVLAQDTTSLYLNVQAVPLPAALWLMMGACGVLVGRRRAHPARCSGE